MAYKLNGKIISQRFKPKIAKQIQDKELGKFIFYIEPETFDLWEGKIIEKKGDIYICDMKCRRITRQGEKKIIELKKGEFSFLKKK